MTQPIDNNTNTNTNTIYTLNNHTWIHDLIDINPDLSVQIYYCMHCFTTFDQNTTLNICHYSTT